MAITYTPGDSYQVWTAILEGASNPYFREGPGIGYDAYGRTSVSEGDEVYVYDTSGDPIWIYFYDSGLEEWGWCASETGDPATGNHFEYFRYSYSDYEDGYYSGSAIEYYYWPTSPTAYSSTALKEYTFTPDNQSSTPLKSYTYGNQGNFIYDVDSSDIILKKNIRGTVTDVQTGTKTVKETYAHKSWATSKPTSITTTSDSDIGPGKSFNFKVGNSSKKFYAIFDDPTSSTDYSNNEVTSITDPSGYNDTDTKYTLLFSDIYNTHSAKTATVTKTYSFTRWNDSDGNEVTFPITFTSDTTITAQYSLSKTQYQSITLPKPTKTNYIFEGWEDSSGKIYEGGTSYEVKSTHTLTARWKLNNVKITLNNNKNWTGSYAPTGSGEYVPETIITINQPIKPGYHFVKWTNTSGITIATTASYQLTVPSEDMTYTANVEANKYTIEYQKNNGTGSMSKSTYTYDISQKLTRNTFTRIGYEFLGWSQNPEDKEPTYYDQQEIINLTTINNNNIILYAIWKPNGTVRISIDGNMNKKAQVYIFHEGAWHLTQPQTNYNNEWKINGG